jgi:hypothetical protein
MSSFLVGSSLVAGLLVSLNVVGDEALDSATGVDVTAEPALHEEQPDAGVPYVTEPQPPDPHEVQELQPPQGAQLGQGLYP